MSEITYELAHVGINASDPEEALAVARLFADMFRLPVKEGSSSIYAGDAAEVIKTPGRGRLGHIGMAVADCEAAIKDLESRGYEFDMSSAKYRPDGTMYVVYLKQEIGGFAVHILKKN